MRKRTKSKLQKRDALVALLCLLLSSLFGFLFWRDLNSYTVRRDGKEAIATIEFKQRIAQRKFDDRVVWERVGQNAPLYDNDTIRTADLSEAIIHFTDGTSLAVGENTMLQISLDKDKGVRIAVDGGDIQVDSSQASSAVSVTLSDGSAVQVDAGSTLSASSDVASGVSSIAVKSGTAQVTTAAGESAALAVGDAVSIEESGMQKASLAVLSPARDVKLLRREGEAAFLDFSWSQYVPDGESPRSVVLQTSASKDFSRVAGSYRVSDGERYRLSLTDSGGVLYWRLFIADEDDKATTGKVTLIDADAVSAVAPLADGGFGYRTALPQVNFRWLGNDYASRYRLAVSTTPDMRSVVAEGETAALFLALDTLAAGTYYWQVTPFYALNGVGFDEAGASEVRSFVITKYEELRAPELSSPADGAELTYRGEATASFIWKSELKDADYELVISRDYAFADVTYSATISGQTRFVQRFDAGAAADGGDGGIDGRYYWKVVRHSDDADDVTPESAVRSFTLSRYVPQANRLLYPPEGYSTEGAKLGSTAFMWKLSDDYAGAPAVLQIAAASDGAEADFAAPQLERRVESGASLDGLLLSHGRYWWRVGALDADGSATGFTSPRSFTVLQELGAAAITAPLSQTELLAYGGSPVGVSWNAVDGADYYNVRVFALDDAPDGGGPQTERLVAEQGSVRGTDARFVLDAARYSVRVQPVAAETETSALRTGALSTREFVVRAPDPVRQLSPQADAALAGLTALREPTTFSWQDGADAASSYQFQLYKRQKDGSLKQVVAIDTQKRTVAFDRLTEGSYCWKVNASTADGMPLDSSERDFTVGAVAELPRAALTAPKNRLVMDFDYLRKNRTITFSWEPVAGATDYSFTLYKKGAKGAMTPVYSEKALKTTSVRLKKLTLLEVGEFSWQVTAYAHAKDGYEEQQSRAAAYDFKVSFDQPKQVQTIQPERMYAQ